jgi:hypothetical protein
VVSGGLTLTVEQVNLTRIMAVKKEQAVLRRVEIERSLTIAEQEEVSANIQWEEHLRSLTTPAA